MSVITLSKEDTLKLIYESRKQKEHKVNYIFKTKEPWYCLKCLKRIYISFTQDKNPSIFCNEHITEALTKDKELKLIQVHYLRYVKEKQLKILESHLDTIKIE